MKGRVFPVGLKLFGRRCLVIGSGEEAARRTHALVEAGALVKIVAKESDPAFRALASHASVELAIRSFDESDLDGVWLAVLADYDENLAARLHDACEKRCLFFCAVDQPAHANFSHLAVARTGPVSVAISTDGQSPALARRLREELERVFSSVDFPTFVERLSALRRVTPREQRRDVLARAVKVVRLTGGIELPDDEGDRGDRE